MYACMYDLLLYVNLLTRVQVDSESQSTLSIGTGLDLTTQEWDFEEVGGECSDHVDHVDHVCFSGRIQENLDDEIVKEALTKVRIL